MNNPKISIIVPIYKAERYLCRCLDSIQQQTFSDWECILVDDGSPDCSGAICDEYAIKDSRFRVIHKENGGVSAARQTGHNAAIGEYVIHVDPDDWVESDMLEELYGKAMELDVDVVMCDYYEEDVTHQKYVNQKPTSLGSEQIFKELFQQLHGSCCNKLVKRVCYSKYGITFPKGYTLMEDLYVTAALYSHEVSTYYLPKAFYHYIQDENANSLVRRPTKSSAQSIERFVVAFSPLWEQRSMFDTMYRYKYHAKYFAMNCGEYTRREIRSMFSEINTMIRKSAMKNLLKDPSIIEVFLSMYVPHRISKGFSSILYYLRELVMSFIKKVKRRIACLIYNNVAKHLPASYSSCGALSQKLRGWCCRQFLTSVGNNVNIEKGATFESPYIKIGDNSGIGVNAHLHGTITIGDDVMMGAECIIYTRNHNTSSVDEPMRNQGFLEEKPVVIGSDVWVGGRVIILPGVKIGKGSVIGAGSVVTKEVPEYTVVAGNPAVVKKYRR